MAQLAAARLEIDDTAELLLRLIRVDPGTIGFQIGQSYTQWVPLPDPDLALAILPIGQSEHPGSPWRTSTIPVWKEGILHPAPLSIEREPASWMR